MYHTFRRPTVLVIGATGAQGGSVARHLLADGRWTVRAFTRDPHSSAARVLRDAGAEVAVGDLGDRTSVRAAMELCHGVYGVTDFWEHYGREMQHGRNIVDAAADAGVRHLVLHTRADYHRLSEGELVVPQCDLKADVERHARRMRVPSTFVDVAFYYENFLGRFAPRRRDEGTWAFGFPQGDVPLAAVSADDVGGVVAAVFARRDDFIGRTIGVVGDQQPCRDYAATLGHALGRPVAYAHVPRATFAASGTRGAALLANMFDVQRRWFVDRTDDIAQARALYPRLRTLAQWATANVRAFDRVFRRTSAAA